MKQYTVYVCETCGYESRNVEDMRKHEASHLGLTIEDADYYNNKLCPICGKPIEMDYSLVNDFVNK